MARRKTRLLALPTPFAYPLAGLFAPLTAFLIVTAKFEWVGRLMTSPARTEQPIDRLHVAHPDSVVRMSLNSATVDVYFGCSPAMPIPRIHLEWFLRDLRRERKNDVAIEIRAADGVTHGEVIATADMALRAGFEGVIIEGRALPCED